MRKITLELQVGTALDVEGFKKYLETTELMNRTILNLSYIDEESDALQDTDLIAIPVNRSGIYYGIVHGSILNYAHVEGSRTNRDYGGIADEVGDENMYCSEDFITFNSKAIQSAYTLAGLYGEYAYKVRDIPGKPYVGVIELLSAKELFELMTRGVPVSDIRHLSRVISRLDNIADSRKRNSIDPTPVCQAFMDLFCEHLTLNKEEVTDELIKFCIKELCSLTTSVDLTDYVERLLDLSSDKKQSVFDVSYQIRVSKSRHRPLLSVRNKPCVIKLLHTVGYVTDLELETARNLFYRPEEQWVGLDFCKSYILNVYLSFLVRDGKTYKKPNYATDHFMFSLLMNNYTDHTLTSSINSTDFESEEAKQQVVADHFDSELKPLLINLFKAQALDSSIFRSHVIEIIFVFNALYRIFKEPKMLSEFTNTLAPYIETQSLKTVEKAVGEIYKHTILNGQDKGLLFNDCSNCKNVKKMVMIQKLGK